jgi:DNA replication initiation complex subunit (GINS family)
MSGDGIGFTEISDVHREERKGKTLTKLPSKFYVKAEEYLAQRREEYAKQSSNPGNTAAMMLQDEIKKVDKRLKQIYQMRERKIVLASLSGTKPDNMAPSDRALYEELIEVLAHYRKSGESRSPKVREVVDVEPVEALKPTVECQTEFVDTEESETESEIDSTIVQVLEDIPPFVGVDHTYVLKKNEIVTLPAQFADLLSSKGKVRIVEG